jgi:PEP-CTERM motif
MGMKGLQKGAHIIGLIAVGVLVPFHAYATNSPNGVPEPVSLALLAVGAAGVGAAAWIRRRKDK